MPEIPDHLLSEAKNFIQLCLQRDPSARPTAQKLIEHPFIRDQSARKATNVRITRDAFPYMFDGSRTPPRVPNDFANAGKSGIWMDWIRRLKVALGAARGLAYFHELADPPIITY
ncbi:Mitogen-activated protein kinase kinase kinase 3 [Glycine soja]